VFLGNGGGKYIKDSGGEGGKGVKGVFPGNSRCCRTRGSDCRARAYQEGT
jgi:hypothetical protein